MEAHRERQGAHTVIVHSGRGGISDAAGRVFVLERLELVDDRAVGVGDFPTVNSSGEALHELLLGQRGELEPLDVGPVGPALEAAWAYIHQPENAAKSSGEEVRTMKVRIRWAAEARWVALPDPDEFVELMDRDGKQRG
jgi:hypothetical protein